MKKFYSWALSLLGYKVPTTSEVKNTTTVFTKESFNPTIIKDVVDESEETDETKDEIEKTIVRTAPSKYAVLVGINKYAPALNADLNGCVNDAQDMYKVLTETYGFPKDNIRMLTDFRATKSAIISRVHWLLSHRVPGDELVWHFSGHGSQVRDRNGDELDDQLDEIICTTDLNWDDPFTDDIIADLFKTKANGVYLTFISDSCHSGSIDRELSPQNNPNKSMPKYIKPPVDIMARSIGRDLPINTFGAVNKDPNITVIDQNHVLLSGCRDDQTSADAFVDGKYQGALTSSLIKAINNNPIRPLTDIHAEIISILNVGGYTQKPQLSGNPGLIRIRNIFGSK